MKIKYNIDLMKFMSLFETITGAKLKDCFEEEGMLTFVVQPGQIGKAIGRSAVNVKRLERALNRKIKIVEFNTSLERFIQNCIFPLKPKEIREEDGVYMLVGGDAETKGLLIGRNARNLRSLEKTVRRYFEVKEIKVI